MQSEGIVTPTVTETAGGIDAGPDAETIELALPGEPLVVDVGLRGITLRRIDLNRDNETLTGWIRQAVFAHLDIDRDGGTAYPNWPVGYDPMHDTDDAMLAERVAAADDGEYVRVRLELPAGIIENLPGVLVEDPVLPTPSDEIVPLRIRQIVGVRLRQCDRAAEIKPTITVEMPPELARRARLAARAKHTSPTSNCEHESAFMAALLELVQPQTRFVLEDDSTVLASFTEGSEVDDAE